MTDPEAESVFALTYNLIFFLTVFIFPVWARFRMRGTRRKNVFGFLSAWLGPVLPVVFIFSATEVHIASPLIVGAWLYVGWIWALVLVFLLQMVERWFRPRSE